MQQLNILNDIEENEVVKELENDEWKEYKLGELVEIKYGKDHKNLSDGRIPVYGTGGIMRYVDRFIYEHESVLIPRKGSLNNLFYVNKPFWSVDTIFWTKVNPNKIVAKHLFYLLKTLDLSSMNTGSAVPSLTTDVLNKIELKIPSLDEQKQIAKILSSLDDKIELNQKINKTLEEMAQAIFKHWFIDFEFPNEEGKPYKSSGGEMVDSELGDIPKGWSVSSYSDLVNISSGKNLKRDEFIEDGKYLVIGANGEIGKTNKYLINEEVILTGRVGTLGTVFLNNEKIWPSDNVLISKAKNYYYYYTKN